LAHAGITQILDGVVRVAEAAKQRVHKTPDGADIFMRNYSGNARDGYLPNVAVLNEWRIAFTSGELPPDSSRS
jgi:hypothetical protein